MPRVKTQNGVEVVLWKRGQCLPVRGIPCKLACWTPFRPLLRTSSICCMVWSKIPPRRSSFNKARRRQEQGHSNCQLSAAVHSCTYYSCCNSYACRDIHHCPLAMKHTCLLVQMSCGRNLSHGGGHRHLDKTVDQGLQWLDLSSSLRRAAPHGGASTSSASGN